MASIVLHSCQRRCQTVNVFHLVREATGMGLVAAKAVIDELYSGRGTVSVELPESVDAERLAADLRACGTGVTVTRSESPG